MSRDPAGCPRGEDERRAEADADQLACELLAPAELLHDTPDRDELTRRLMDEFGLPASVASEYALQLLPPPPSPGGLIARLKKSQ
jgi:Zn-dependent peptidase ImmA (M78 family)